MSKLPVTAKDILDSDGRFPERRNGANQWQRDEAAALAARVNHLFLKLGMKDRPAISSGLRDKASNQAAGGARKSAHLEGKAVDFADSDGRLKKAAVTAEEAAAGFSQRLADCGLRMEHPSSTPTWAHFDTRQPHGRIFTP